MQTSFFSTHLTGAGFAFSAFASAGCEGLARKLGIFGIDHRTHSENPIERFCKSQLLRKHGGEMEGELRCDRASGLQMSIAASTTQVPWTSSWAWCPRLCRCFLRVRRSLASAGTGVWNHGGVAASFTGGSLELRWIEADVSDYVESANVVQAAWHLVRALSIGRRAAEFEASACDQIDNLALSIFHAMGCLCRLDSWRTK